jgi:hypothetical protein
MYYTTYYYPNSLSVTVCNVIKISLGKTFFKTLPKRKSWIRRWCKTVSNGFGKTRVLIVLNGTRLNV